MEIKDIMLKHEKNYSKYACLSKDSIRLKNFTPDIRPNFFRDTDRIIYSSSYNRYIGKTQVFTMPTNDNISRRSIHVQLVAKIARSIGRALSLNEDLIEAIALGHDLGHVPYGHVGEKFLNEISLKHNEGYFNHNVQSVRNLMVLENNGEGLNLSIQVLDGILCHNGELPLSKYEPKPKTKEDFLNDYYNCYKIKEYNNTLIPMTLEGCIVRLSDIIAYLGRDIEDAEKLGLINKKDIPTEISNVLGTTNREIVNTLITNVVQNSINKNYINVDDKVFNALNNLKEFNYKNIYNKIYTKEELNNIKNKFEFLFDNLLNSLNNKDTNSRIYTNFYLPMNKEYKETTTNERIVIDYIAGMTDEYFLNEYKHYQSK